MLNDVATSALIDSGASCNLLGKAQLRELRQRGLRVDLKPYDGSLFAYGARTPLDVVGQFLATVSAGSQTRKKVPFVVTRAPGRLLLGRTSAVDLGLLRLYPKGVPRHVVSVTQELDDESKFRHNIEQQYAKLFTGVGKLTDYQATIHMVCDRVCVHSHFIGRMRIPAPHSEISWHAAIPRQVSEIRDR